jgi:transposase
MNCIHLWRSEATASGSSLALRHNPVMRAFHERLLAKSKATKVALVACMHKLLTMLNPMVKNGADWQPPRLSVPQTAVPLPWLA